MTAVVATVTGVGEAGIGTAPEGYTDLDILGVAAHRAMNDAGIGPSDVDAVFTAAGPYPMAPLNVAQYIGVRPRYFDGTNTGGNSFISHLHHAAAAIAAGQCTTALICYGSTQKSDGKSQATMAEPPSVESVYGARDPLSMYALAAARHMSQFGTTREQMAEVAVASRRWAVLNPAATARDPLTVGDVIGARTISTPFTVRDCCLMTDGAGAVIVTRADMAVDQVNHPIDLLGSAEAATHRNISSMPDLTTTCAVDSGQRAFAAAGLSPADIDIAMLYDAFTITPILFLEDLGFCAKGEGGAFVADYGIGPGGGIPVNPNGGGLSHCHPGMYGIFLIIEAVRQLRRETGDRQVAGAETALVHGNGGVLSAQSTAILGRRR